MQVAVEEEPVQPVLTVQLLWAAVVEQGQQVLSLVHLPTMQVEAAVEVHKEFAHFRMELAAG